MNDFRSDSERIFESGSPSPMDETRVEENSNDASSKEAFGKMKRYRKNRNPIHPRRRPDAGAKSERIEPGWNERVIPEIFAGVLSCLAHEFVKRASREVGVNCCDVCLSDAGVEITVGGKFRACLCPDCQRELGIGLNPGVACRVCGCTDEQACPGGCYWVESDLCSRCADDARLGPLEDRSDTPCRKDEES